MKYKAPQEIEIENLDVRLTVYIICGYLWGAITAYLIYRGKKSLQARLERLEAEIEALSFVIETMFEEGLIR